MAVYKRDPHPLQELLQTLRESYTPEQKQQIWSTFSPQLRSRIHALLKDQDPRQAITREKGSLEVDLEKLDLNYHSPVPIPEWKPTLQLKPYEQLSKLYLDIDASGLDPAYDRVLMVGFMDHFGSVTLLTDPDERQILIQTLEFLRSHPHELLIGHNLFQFDLPFLMTRWDLHGIPHLFSYKKDHHGQQITQTITASSFHSKPIQFHPITCSGIQILDTFHQICIWDKSAAKLESYNLKSCVLTLGLRDTQRLDLSPDQIQNCWANGDLQTLSQYLHFDLEDTQRLADFLLPVVYYQLAVVPQISFQDLAVASPALKAQRIHQSLLPNLKPEADPPVHYGGGTVECITPGLHRNVAKIDISSLYPSIMLRFGICSRKDPEHKFLGVMQYMTQERLHLKQLAKEGNIQAHHEQNALKILINGSYGFLGTGGYTFNDYEAAALVTAYGRKILQQMKEVVEENNGILIELDTDGIFFSHPQPQDIVEKVQHALPDGIMAELELSSCGMYVPKAKSYVIIHPNGKTTIKGIFRKRNRYPLERIFPVEFLKRYFLESEEVAFAYYQKVRESIQQRRISIEELTITHKIGSAEKQLLKLGKPGEVVSYFYVEQKRIHPKSRKLLSSVAAESTTGDYWIDWYLNRLDQQVQEMTGIQVNEESQLPISLV
ncbi:MAG: DNA polymerase domain-containing protein [Cyanobacteriota bacterium]|nr:DNA polymerase domain-containing protein [Cyanobacteriota bacterium]